MAPFNPGPSLVVISETGRARQIPIPFGGIVLGRDPRLGPPFSTDEFISRQHASVQPYSTGVEIADLGSVNGTYVNGMRVRTQARMQDGDVLRIGQIALKLAAPAAGAPAEGYPIDGQRGEIINNVGRDQVYSYAIQQRKIFLREIAATKTTARWLIGTGFVSLAAGFAVFAAGLFGFIKQVGGSVSTGTAPSDVAGFGPTIGGVPTGLIGWATGALGVLLIIAGIVLHIAATSRRRRVDQELPTWPGRSAA